MKGFAEELEKKKVELDNILFEFVPVTLANSLRQQRPVPASQHLYLLHLPLFT